MNKCLGCTKQIKSNDLKTCSVCVAHYHYQCLGVSSDNFLKESKQYKANWKCPQCKVTEKRGGDNTNTPIRQQSVDSPRISLDIEDLKMFMESRFECFKEQILKEVKQSLENYYENMLKRTEKVEESIAHLSVKYDDFSSKMSGIDQDMKSLKKQQECICEENGKMKREILLLQSKLEEAEQRSRSHNVEIRGVPESESENLLIVIENLCSYLKMNLDPSEVCDIFRSGRKILPDKPRPIVVIFKSLSIRNNLLRLVKQFNKNCKDSSARFKTDYLCLDLHSRPVYVSEHLTLKMKQLFGKSRQVALKQNFKFCWYSNGRIYLKKDENSKPVPIINEESLCCI